MSPRSEQRRNVLPGALVVLTCSLLLGLVAPPSAWALPADGSGNYTQILCANPATGEGLGLSGMPEGLSNPASIDLWQVTAAEVDCGSGPVTSGRGVPMVVGQTNTYAQGTWSALLYQAPANATINGGTIYRAEKAEGSNNGFMGIIQQGGEYSVLYSLPRNCCDQGDWYVGNVAARGTFTTPFSPENVVNLTISPDGGHWDVNATCDPNGNNNSSCTLTAGQWEYRIFGGEISLNAPHDPQASNIAGPLLTEDPLRSTESITFSATDEGPGLAYVKLLVDGVVVQSQIIDTNGGHCIPVPGHDAYTWAYQVPCMTSVGGRTYSLNTALLPNGLHHMQVIIEDAAGNQSEVLNRMVTTENAGAGSLGALPGPGSSVLLAGAPNGSNASESATLQLGLPRSISRPFARRALRLPGRLVNSHGEAISGATLDVTQQVVGGGSSQVIAHATTGADGSFIASVPAGPSRLIDVAYRAFTGESGYAAQARIQESVRAGVQLSVSPHRTGSEGTITLSGQVDGLIPAQGVVVDLLVHYRGRWEPFRTPRTNSQGRFRVLYQFEGGVGRFPFRALAFGGQAGFAFSSGESGVVDVSTG
ncbi:MAG TPA: carboxypeptidase-like regulatory domain-containing protein [Solirubrobacteraceae bacterium]|nr:carboxypeptidase-like regulatory domain-containing protein [Solirubrobacteraceae bacterium]